jgi:8-oxo-dGTP diphosphatase
MSTPRSVDAAVPQVGVGVIVLRDGRVLLGERKGSHGAGTWALPGGHLEFGEDVAACAARELAEETGLVAGGFTAAAYTNDVFAAEHRHYVTLFVLAAQVLGEPRVCEPDKCGGWQWFDWDALPAPLFAPVRSLQRSGWRPPDGR